MRAAVVDAYDCPPRYAEFADPVAGDGEVLQEAAEEPLSNPVKEVPLSDLDRVWGLKEDGVRLVFVPYGER